MDWGSGCLIVCLSGKLTVISAERADWPQEKLLVRYSVEFLRFEGELQLHALSSDPQDN